MRNIHTYKSIFFWYFVQVLQLAARSHLPISMSDANIRFSLSAFGFCHEIYNFIREKSILRGMRFSVRLFIAMSRFVRPSVRPSVMPTTAISDVSARQEFPSFFRLTHSSWFMSYRYRINMLFHELMLNVQAAINTHEIGGIYNPIVSFTNKQTNKRTNSPYGCEAN